MLDSLVTLLWSKEYCNGRYTKVKTLVDNDERKSREWFSSLVNANFFDITVLDFNGEKSVEYCVWENLCSNKISL